MLRKILGAIGSLALFALGVALIGGWLSPDDINPDSGRGKSRLIKNAIVWLTDTLGTAGAGALVCASGAALLFFTLRPAAKAAPKQPS